MTGQPTSSTEVTWLSTGQAAELLHIHTRTVLRWIARGDVLPGVRVRRTLGGHHQLAEADVRATAPTLIRPKAGRPPAERKAGGS